jgi:hypothetical protein
MWKMNNKGIEITQFSDLVINWDMTDLQNPKLYDSCKKPYAEFYFQLKILLALMHEINILFCHKSSLNLSTESRK